MRSRIAAALAALAVLTGCATTGRVRESGPAAPAQAAAAGSPKPVTVKIIAFNDFHGNLQPPRLSVPTPAANGATVDVPAGGAAYFASAVAQLRAQNPNHVVVSAGDMISASPLVSSLFLDEPTIAAMNLIGVDFNAPGNHEYDRGRQELLRMQHGGCEKFTRREPCQLDRFEGARFGFLAANTLTETGDSLFPATAIKSFGSGASQVKIGFIGMTLKGTPLLVNPEGLRGLSFADEAATANALVPKLKAQGADAIVVLIHQGAYTKVGYNDKSCGGVTGDILPILAQLDPAVDLVVSGHTHRAYICDYGRTDPSRPILLTSAGLAGTLLTDIELTIDPVAHRVIAKSADNLIVQGEAYTGKKGAVPLSDAVPRYQADPRIAELVSRYATAAEPLAKRVVGRLSAPAKRDENWMTEQVLGDLIADAQLAATSAPERGGAQLSFMNPGGVRTDLVPAADGSVTYGDIYAVQPFGNNLVVKSYTGRQLLAILEEQFTRPEGQALLMPSHTLSYGYDLSRPAGQRVRDVRIAGQPLREDATYRVTISNFLEGGGDGFHQLSVGTNTVGGPQDLDALEAYLANAGTLTPPTPNRIRNLTPPQR